MDPVRFHLAFPVGDIALTKQFYVEGLGCSVGRENPHSVILNLGGHQLVAHLTQDPLPPQQGIYPRHFGLIVPSEAAWDSLRDRAIQHQLPFYAPPRWRFPGQVTEHATFFLQDPFHNLLEFKFYRHPEAIFGATELSRIGDRDDQGENQEA